MDLTGFSITLGSFVVIANFILGLFTFLTNRKKLTKQESEHERTILESSAKQHEQIMIKLTTIENELVHVRADINSQEQKYDALEARVRHIETSKSETKQVALKQMKGVRSNRL